MIRKKLSQEFILKLKNFFFIRLHMSFIIAGTISTGLLTSRMLLWAGVDAMSTRYFFSLIATYLAFLGLIRLWLYYIFGYHKPDTQKSNTLDAVDTIDLFSNLEFKSVLPNTDWSGSGGKFSGGGASGSWGEGDSKLSLDSVDVGDEGGAIIIGLLAILGILAALGFSFYLIFEAPIFLGEIALEMGLSLGLIQKLKKAQGDWLAHALKKTWWVFVLLLIIFTLLGHFCQVYCPEAKTILEVWNELKQS